MLFWALFGRLSVHHNLPRFSQMLDCICPLKSPAWKDAKSYKFSEMLISHKSPQIACLNVCKVTLVACERFSEMLYYTCPLKSPAWTITLVACVRFSQMLYYTCSCPLNSPAWTEAKWHKLHVRFFYGLVFTCLFKSPAWTYVRYFSIMIFKSPVWTDAKSH